MGCCPDGVYCDSGCPRTALEGIMVDKKIYLELFIDMAEKELRRAIPDSANHFMWDRLLIKAKNCLDDYLKTATLQ